jgi:hypothetical protein
MPPAANVTDVQGIVDHAASQSDRWLFVALLLVGGLAFFFAAKWLAGQYQQMLGQWRNDMAAMAKQLAELHTNNQQQMATLHVERVKAADAYAGQLREIQREQAENARDMARIYSDALVKNAEVMGGVQTTLRDLQNSCAIARANLSTGGFSPPRRGGDASGGVSPAHHHPTD